MKLKKIFLPHLVLNKEFSPYPSIIFVGKHYWQVVIASWID